MAIFHVQTQCISKGVKGRAVTPATAGKAHGGSVGFATYICRADVEHATQHARYLEREGRSDLEACGYGGLPSWARSHDGARNDQVFWRAADRFERKNATIARCFTITLPREIGTKETRKALVEDIVATYFERFPHTFAIHVPLGSDGKVQPHVHIQMHERQDDGIERTPKAFFSRYVSSTDDVAAHGVRKDRSWQGLERFQEFRAGVATLINAALEREGYDIAVSHATLKARGFDRSPEEDLGRGTIVLLKKYEEMTLVQVPEKQRERVATARQAWDGVLEQRHERYKTYTKWENDVNRTEWNRQKEREGITDLSREAMVDHVRTTFWAKDQSPARTKEREQAQERAVLRALVQAWEASPPEREAQRDRSRRAPWVMHGGLDDTPHGGVHMDLDRERGA